MKYLFVFLFVVDFQEMLAIMTSIYDMMGRYTLPSVKEDSPFEHVEKFFQVGFIFNTKKFLLMPIMLILTFFKTKSITLKYC